MNQTGFSKNSITVFWDFDGTLVSRPSVWSESFLEVLNENIPRHPYEVQSIRKQLSAGFPWHSPDKPWLDCTEPEAWWDRMSVTFESALRNLGVEGLLAARLGKLVRHHVLLNQKKNTLFEDVIPALDLLKGRGIRQIILSNHVPELNQIVSEVGITSYFDEIISSALIGYCKPHEEIFRYAKNLVNSDQIWMVGDNVDADFHGAIKAGMSAILIRAKNSDVSPAFENALEAARYIISGEKHVSQMFQNPL